ncbi:uncharacterized protein LOC142224147 [Haematobia irritans]|uniref:uncharacterized protein LOC142224147 n=1 Tax=Haematobia irritans TaxID=7368 RepID=UPI003F4FA6D2
MELRDNTEIQTFVILDVEINQMPELQFNKCSLTEFCMYAFSAKYLINDVTKDRIVKRAPDLPRVLYKQKLMINPMARISDRTLTGLDNYMLEEEAPFNENTADCIMMFLNQLKHPICLVAHNGMNHDFRIIRHVFDKVERIFPSNIFCVDSLKAFREIDNIISRDRENSITQQENNLEENVENRSLENIPDDINPNENIENDSNIFSNISEVTHTVNEDNCNHLSLQKLNETTPKRKVTNDVVPGISKKIKTDNTITNTSVKRKLKFFTKKRSYRLGELYRNVFPEEEVVTSLHTAETDVQLLSQLILHYGIEFLEFAKHQKQPFCDVAKLGQK